MLVILSLNKEFHVHIVRMRNPNERVDDRIGCVFLPIRSQVNQNKRRLIVYKGDFVKKGQQLTDGDWPPPSVRQLGHVCLCDADRERDVLLP